MTAPRFDLLSVRDEEGLTLTYGTEADLRDALCAYASAYGWGCETEVHVPGWGRVDLLAELGIHCWAIEIKVAVQQQSTLRRGLNQVHGYASALKATRGPHVLPILTAPDMPEWAEAMAAVAYPDTELHDVSSLMGELRFRASLLADREATFEDHPAVALLTETEHEAAVRNAAVSHLRAFVGPSDDEDEIAGGVIIDDAPANDEAAS